MRGGHSPAGLVTGTFLSRARPHRLSSPFSETNSAGERWQMDTAEDTVPAPKPAVPGVAALLPPSLRQSSALPPVKRR